MATTPSPLPIPHQMRTALDHYKFTLSLKTSVKKRPIVKMLCKSVRRCGQSKIILNQSKLLTDYLLLLLSLLLLLNL